MTLSAAQASAHPPVCHPGTDGAGFPSNPSPHAMPQSRPAQAPVDLAASAMQPHVMARVALGLALSLLLAAPVAAETIPPPAAPIPPYLRIGDSAVPLRGIVTSTTCVQRSPGELPGGCVVGDGVAPPRVSISGRVRVPFRGAIGIVVGPNTDSVAVTYGRSGRQPVWRFDPLQPISWPVPGSGTYYLFVEIASHTDRTQSRITYAVALHAPRS